MLEDEDEANRVGGFKVGFEERRDRSREEEEEGRKGEGMVCAAVAELEGERKGWEVVGEERRKKKRARDPISAGSMLHRGLRDES